jgi:glucosamine--fructose-6-phosphate aminotransferase (isomerizing)
MTTSQLIATKNGSPLILGIKKNVKELKGEDHVPVKAFGRAESSVEVLKNATAEFFLSSDATAIVEHTQSVIYLQDKDLMHFKSM